jgi:hypothetical protein
MKIISDYIVLPNWLIKFLGIFIPIMKELAEMNYQFDRDYYFDSNKFTTYFNFKPTSNCDAIKRVVNQMSN